MTPAPAQAAQHDVAIIGSGIIGVTLAWKLSRAGRAVTLIDRADPGRGCSFGNAATFATEQIFPLADPANLKDLPRYLLSADSPLTFRRSSLLRVLPWGLRFIRACRQETFARGTAALRALNRRALPAWRQLLEEIGAAHLLRDTGSLHLAESARGRSELQAMQRELQLHDVRCSMLSPVETRDRLGDLPPGEHAGLYFPDTAYCLDPHAFLLAVFEACRSAGVTFLRHDVRALTPESDGRVRIDCDGASLHAADVVVACGAHSGALLKTLGQRVPLIAERGYHLQLPAAGIRLELPLTLHERQFVMTPMDAGVRLAGTVEFAQVDDPPTMKRAAMLFRQASEVFPTLDRSGSTSWMGCRPTLPDYLPVIDRLGPARRVHASFGHAHLGLTQAAVSAELAADRILGRAPAIDLGPFAIGRFQRGGPAVAGH